MVDLGTLDGTGGYEWPGTVAWGINNRGQVVGWSRTGVDPRVLVGGGGRMTDLGTLGGRESAARVINNRGQVAGFSDTASLEPHVVLWSKK